MLAVKFDNIQMVSVESLWKVPAGNLCGSLLDTNGADLWGVGWPAGPYVNACILCLQGASTGL